MKSKSTAAMLALFLGGLGIHHFYLGNALRGIFYAMFCWTFIPSIIGILEAIGLALKSEDRFNRLYN